MLFLSHSRSTRSLLSATSFAFGAALMLSLPVRTVSAQAAVDAGVPRATEDQDTPQPASTSGLVPPELERFVEADYPEAAAAAGRTAAVELMITIASDGSVTDVQVVEPVGDGFDEAAVAAARQFRFKPAMKDGDPVAARIHYRYVFEQKPPQPPPNPAAPQPGAITGAILVGNKAIPGAEIVVSSEDGSIAKRALTDESGRFAIEELPSGAYTVVVLADGYQTSEQREEVESGEATVVTYRLSAIAAPGAEGPTFGARAVIEPPPREVTRRSITQAELTRVPGTRGDALRTVELLPGVGRPPFGAGALIVRGSAPQDSQVYLDGHPVPLLYHFGGVTSFINSRILEQIDFYPGNFSSRYGRKMGGVLEVSARDPASDGLHGVADINLLDVSILAEAPITDDLSVAVGGRRSYIDVFFENIVPADAFDVVAAPVYYDYQLFLTYKASPVDRIRLNVYGSSDEFRLVFSDPADADPAVRGNLQLETSFHRIYAGWRRKLSDRIDQDISFSFGPNNVHFALGSSIEFDSIFYQAYLRSEWTARVSDSVRLIAGIDIAYTPFDVHFVGPPPTQGEGAEPRGTPSTESSISFEESGTAYRPGAYLETHLRPLPPLQLIVGMRLDWMREIEEWSFDPRLAAIVSITHSTNLKGGVGLYSQPPEFQESAERIGNPSLEPIQAIHTGFGVDHDFGERISLGVEGFYKHLYSRVVSTERGLAPFFINDGVGRIYGLEVAGRVEPQGRRFFGFLSYTLSRSERRDRGATEYRLFDFDQTHILTVSGVYLLGKGWEAGATFRLVSGNPYTPIVGGVYDANADVYVPISGRLNSERNPLFHRLDVRVEKKWDIGAAKLAVYLDIQNVYNATNREGVGYNYDFTETTDVPGLPFLPSIGVRGEL